MESIYCKSSAHLVIGEEKPVIGQKYECYLLTPTNTVQSKKITIENFSAILEVTQRIFQVSVNKESYIILLPQSTKCRLYKVIKGAEVPTIGNKLRCEILKEIKRTDEGFTTSWEPHISSPVLRMNGTGDILKPVTDNSLYYWLPAY